MIKGIDNTEQIEVTIIPKLKEFNELSLSPGDTLVVFLDRNKWDIDQAQEINKLLKFSFPKNNICIMYDGVKLGVFRYDDKKRDKAF